jgi:hypothetical protein
VADIEKHSARPGFFDTWFQLAGLRLIAAVDNAQGVAVVAVGEHVPRPQQLHDLRCLGWSETDMNHERDLELVADFPADLQKIQTV